MTWTTTSILGAASGVALLVVAAFLFVLRPRRRGSGWFAGFATLWGAQVLVLGIREAYPSEALTPHLSILAIALILPQPFFVVRFAQRYDPSFPSWVLAPFALTSAIATTSFAISPNSFVKVGAIGSDLAIILVVAPQFVAFFTACGILFVNYWRRATTALRVEHFLLLFAFLTYLGEVATTFAPFYVQRLVTGSGSTVTNAVLGTIFVLGAAMLAVIGALVARRWWVERERLDGWVVAALAFSVALGLVELVLQGLGQPSRLSGILRIFAAVLMMYAMFKHQLFDIDLRLKKTVERGSTLAVFAAVFFGADQGVQLFLSEKYGLIAGLVAAGLLALALAPLHRRVHRIVERAFPGVDATPEYHDRRGSEVYRAAAEAAASDGGITTRERLMLDVLMRELKLAPHAAAEIEREALGGRTAPAGSA